METFKASNGVDVTISADTSGEVYLLGKGGEIEGGSRRWTVATGNSDGIDALREFFQHERDQELGRWRWPEIPDYVIYIDHARRFVHQPAVIVVNERDGGQAYASRDGELSAFGVGARDGLLETAAAAFFVAHPEPKPWHDAKAGDVFAVKWHGCDREEAVTVPADGKWPSAWECVESARRIWPEVSDA